jgi:hypothetical protein
MSWPSDFSSAWTRSSMLALALGGKYCFTQSWPTASPSAPSVMRVQRFQRGCSSFCPCSVALKKAKFSSTKGLESSVRRACSVCQRR